MDLKQWLRQSGHWVFGSDSTHHANKPITHVFLDGGKASVPSTDLAAYFSRCAADVAAGRPIHVVERTHAGGSYRMFADLDVHFDRVEAVDVDEDWDRRLLEGVLGRAIRSLPPELAGRSCVVCTRRWESGKTGAHLIWDGVRVDDDSAKRLRASWVARLAEAESVDPRAAEWWDKTIDAAVYRRNGLRVAWALKRGGSSRAAYVPTHTITEALGLAEVPPFSPTDAGAVATWLALTSIDASTDPLPEAAAAATASASSTGSRGAASSSNYSSGSSWKPQAALSSAAVDALRAALPPAYGSCELGARCSSGDALLWVSSNSRYCHVAGREHGSNHVYFEVLLQPGDGRIFQRCHSTKCEHGSRVEVGRLSAAALDVVVPPSEGRKQKRKCGSLVPLSPATAVAYWLSRLTKGKDV
jgi:hypothetical protein